MKITAHLIHFPQDKCNAISSLHPLSYQNVGGWAFPQGTGTICPDPQMWTPFVTCFEQWNAVEVTLSELWRLAPLLPPSDHGPHCSALLARTELSPRHWLWMTGKAQQSASKFQIEEWGRLDHYVTECPVFKSISSFSFLPVPYLAFSMS